MYVHPLLRIIADPSKNRKHYCTFWIVLTVPPDDLLRSGGGGQAGHLNPFEVHVCDWLIPRYRDSIRSRYHYFRWPLLGAWTFTATGGSRRFREDAPHRGLHAWIISANNQLTKQKQHELKSCLCVCVLYQDVAVFVNCVVVTYIDTHVSGLHDCRCVHSWTKSPIWLPKLWRLRKTVRRLSGWLDPQALAGDGNHRWIYFFCWHCLMSAYYIFVSVPCIAGRIQLLIWIESFARPLYTALRQTAPKPRFCGCPRCKHRGSPSTWFGGGTGAAIPAHGTTVGRLPFVVFAGERESQIMSIVAVTLIISSSIHSIFWTQERVAKLNKDFQNLRTSCRRGAEIYINLVYFNLIKRNADKTVYQAFLLMVSCLWYWAFRHLATVWCN